MPSERVGKLLARLRAVFEDWVMPALRRPAESLPSRIIVSVFAAALVTSVVENLGRLTGKKSGHSTCCAGSRRS